ncbi:MAG: hypothetical protein IKW44_04365, partial [Bacteroidaceae bacterium]|nr:hypothetical protein [Bacteroidaceae bacterium]
MNRLRDYEEFVKEAATRWKKEFGNLSNQNRRRLMRQYVNKEKIVSGLEKGNQNLIERLGVQVTSNHNIPAVGKFVRNNFAADTQKKVLGDDVFNSQKDLFSKIPILKHHQDKAVEKMNKGVIRFAAHLNPAGTLQFTQDGPGMVVGFKKSRKHPEAMKTTSRRLLPMFQGGLPKSKTKLSPFDRRALDAAVLRHELDEVRSVRNHGKVTGYASHNAPDVIHRESANIAFMPKNVKRAFINARARIGEKTNLA